YSPRRPVSLTTALRTGRDAPVTATTSSTTIAEYPARVNQSGRNLWSNSLAINPATPSPTAVASSTPISMGTQFCHSSERPSTPPGTPVARSAANARRRCNTCALVSTNRFPPANSSVNVLAVPNTAPRVPSVFASSAPSASREISTFHPNGASTLRRCSTASGTAGSSVTLPGPVTAPPGAPSDRAIAVRSTPSSIANPWTSFDSSTATPPAPPNRVCTVMAPANTTVIPATPLAGVPLSSCSRRTPNCQDGGPPRSRRTTHSPSHGINTDTPTSSTNEPTP